MSDGLRALDFRVESPLERQIVQSLENVAALIHRRGFPCRPYSIPALENLPTLAEEKKQQVFQQLQVLEKVYFREEEPSAPKVDEHPERGLVEQALDFFNLELRDDFWGKVKSDEVIEIYTPEQIQLFRTLNFFNYCGYSLLDLLTKEWYELWGRPMSIVQALKEKADQIFSGAIVGARPFNLTIHLCMEIFNADRDEDFSPRSVMMNAGLICPLYLKDLPIIRGALVTSTATLVAIGKENDCVAFL